MIHVPDVLACASIIGGLSSNKPEPKECLAHAVIILSIETGGASSQ